MKKNTGLLLFVVCFAMVGCNDSQIDNIDNRIPVITTCEKETVAEFSTTPDESVVSNISTSISATDAISESEISSYESTYDGMLQHIYDYLYTYVDEIKAAQGKDGYHREYDTTQKLAETVLEGKSRLYECPPVTSNVKGIVFFPDETIFVRLFEQYPEQAKEETALIEFLRQYCYIFTTIQEFTSEYFYMNDDLYYAMFPNTKEVAMKKQASDVIMEYQNYSGGIVYVTRADRIGSVRNLEICQDSINIIGYTGIVSIAPVNEYGAVGRTTQVYVNAGGEGIKEIVINGDYFLTNPDWSSPEWNLAVNNTEDRTLETNWLDLIDDTEQLQILRISHCKLSDVYALAEKIPCEKIITFDLSGNILTELDLSEFARLDSLDVTDNPSLSILNLPEKDAITAVTLCNTAVEDLSMFTSYRRIGTLDIRGTKIKDLNDLAGKNVQSLLFDADMTDCHGLSDIMNLKILNIVSKNELPADFMKIVHGISTLKELYINNETVALK